MRLARDPCSAPRHRDAVESKHSHSFQTSHQHVPGKHRMRSLHPALINSTLKYWVVKPALPLRGVVRCYFAVDSEGYGYDAEELLLPDGWSEIVFALAANFDRRSVAAPEQRTVMCRSYIIGGRSHSVVTGGSDRLQLIGVKLDPQFLRHIIKTPLSELQDTTLALRTLNLRSLSELENQLADDPHVCAAVSALDNYFIEHLRNFDKRDVVVDKTLQRIRQCRGAGRVHAWARELDVAERTLERRFVESVGMSPKSFARIVRFNDAYHQLLLRRPQSSSRRDQFWLDGYYDQAHFNKDFRYFTGTSPTGLKSSASVSSTAVNDHLLRHGVWD
jgi:AraC-like DNA-binding protein